MGSGGFVGIPWLARNLVSGLGGSRQAGRDLGAGLEGSWDRPVEGYSHSMVPGGLLVTSRTTRLTSGTSLVILVEILASTS
jgi:hypothetical protein